MTFQHETEGDNFEEQILYGGAIALMGVLQHDGRQRLPAELRLRQSGPQLRSVIDVMDETASKNTAPTAAAARPSSPSAPRAARDQRDEIARSSPRPRRGEFARDWMQEWALGMPTLHRMRRTAAKSNMEKTGRVVAEGVRQVIRPCMGFGAHGVRSGPKGRVTSWSFCASQRRAA